MNMEYCRFENTLRDLLDCQKHLNDDTDLLSDIEKAARKRLIEVCVEIGIHAEQNCARSEMIELILLLADSNLNISEAEKRARQIRKKIGETD